MGGYKSRLIVAVVAGLTLTGCAAQAATPPPVPRPSAPQPLVVASVHEPANLVLSDGRRVHVPRMNGARPLDWCDRRADLSFARQLVAGRAVTVSEPRKRDAPGSAPAGFDEADVRLPSGEDYSDTFMAGLYDNRERECAAVETTTTTTTTTTPPPTTATSEVPADTYVDVDVEEDDDGRESRFCRGRWWC